MKAIFALFFATLALSQAKIYNQCELVQTLRDHGVPEWQIGTWVCIASHESNFDTTAINPTTGDYGIFQISQIYWCSNSDVPGNGCGITCQSLLGDDITEDIQCAQHVYSETEALGQDGFSAWTTYQYCMGDNSGWVC